MRDDAEDLRRRLYAPGASPDDVERYRAATPSAPVETAPVAEVAAPATDPDPAVVDAVPGGRPSRRALVVGGAAALVTAGLGGAAVAIGREPDDRVRPRVVATDPADRRTFEESLALGNHAGIAAYLVTHRLRRPADATRYWIIERDGTGTASLDLTPVPAEAVSGRATVFLVLATGGDGGWRTLRRAVDPSGEQRYARQVVRGGPQPAGVLTGTTYRYGRGDRPVLLRIDVEPGVRWGAAVLFSD